MVTAPSQPLALSYHDLTGLPDWLVTLHEPDALARRIPEAVVHDLWGALRFDASDLRTAGGESIAILDPGTPNPDAGPDFSNARLRIGELEWVGDVEIHRTSGEWREHRHDADPAYDRVVLHVVLDADRHTGTLRRNDGTPLPELVLLPHLKSSLRALLHGFYSRPPAPFYCAPRWPEVPEAVWRPWVRRLGRERIQRKAAALAEGYLQRPDLEALLFERVMRALGYAPNADAMLALALRLPLERLRALPALADVEAVLFGTAGLLPEPAHLGRIHPDARPYVEDLWARYLRHAHGAPVRPLSPLHWQFARLRPANAPTRRIAQAAALVAPGGLLHRDPIPSLLDAVEAPRPLAALRALLRSAEPSDFWAAHVRFEHLATPSSARLGRNRCDVILLNAVLPVLLLHADQLGEPDLEERVLRLFERMPAPRNAETERFAQLGTRAQNALEAQGLQELYRTRCRLGHCLSCAVGQHLLNRA